MLDYPLGSTFNIFPENDCSHDHTAVTEVQTPGIIEVVSLLILASILGPTTYSKEPQLTPGSRSQLSTTVAPMPLWRWSRYL